MRERVINKFGLLDWVKITIDTNEDSKEEIKKVIRLLSALADGEIKVNQEVNKGAGKEFEMGGSEVSAFANLFGDAGGEKKTDEPASFGALNILAGGIKKKEDREEGVYKKDREDGENKEEEVKLEFF